MKNATRLKKTHLIKHHIYKIKTSEYFRVLVLRTIGNFLIISSLFFIAKTFYQPLKYEIRYFIESKIEKKYFLSGEKIDESLKQKKNKLAKLFKMKTVEVLTPADPEFSIVIPKIGANSIVFPNVDAANEEEYLEVLRLGVAQASGTAFPGEGGHIFLFAHSTDYIWNVGSYNAIFYLLNKMEKNDEVNIFYQGQRYVYKVIDKIVVAPDKVEYLTRQTNREFLTLQTCWPPGTTLDRLLVFATRIAD